MEVDHKRRRLPQQGDRDTDEKRRRGLSPRQRRVTMKELETIHNVVGMWGGTESEETLRSVFMRCLNFLCDRWTLMDMEMYINRVVDVFDSLDGFVCAELGQFRVGEFDSLFQSTTDCETVCVGLHLLVCETTHVGVSERCSTEELVDYVRTSRTVVKGGNVGVIIDGGGDGSRFDGDEETWKQVKADIEKMNDLNMLDTELEEPKGWFDDVIVDDASEVLGKMR